jgi:hypothetical protein
VVLQILLFCTTQDKFEQNVKIRGWEFGRT